MKTICLMPRRHDVSRAAFRDYYERRHSKLALRWFHFDKYVRNHLTDDAGEPGFDCYSEFWTSNPEKGAGLMSGPVGDTMREDERQFTDQPMIRPALSEEKLVSGPPRGTETGVPHLLLLLVRDGGSDTGLGEWLAGIRCTRVVLDLLSTMDPARPIAYQAGALLWDPPALLPEAPAGWTIAHRLKTEAFEYTPEEMAAMKDVVS
ncbi:EthD domain-containing protein [Flavisphingomonas formosensis]|uniref:EthD domain-containing protein n=1 Tax=Flavisphingomonas formosensis TaxID=861534 RepID=UPI0012FBA810|nr:EthD domain-containing protein [Sphingomonas formosensis]